MKTYLTRIQFPGLVLMLLLSLLNTHTSYAQKLIARQGGGTPTFHTSLDEAITQAVDGDTLYIPGGYFDISMPINKTLHFVGEGHNPKSSSINGVTFINGTFTIEQEASRSSFQGLYVTPIIGLGDGVKFIFFERCNLEYLTYFNNNFKESITCNEVIFRSNIYANMTGSQFNSCIFQGYIRSHIRNCEFRNCIFLTENYPWSPTWAGIPDSKMDYSRIENCIFISVNGITYTNNSIFNNNIFVCDQTFDGTNLIGSNNIVGQIPESIFVNQSGNAFLYEHDYHLKATSPGKNAGTDGKDIGIYGGLSPWKDSCFPFNPHVIFKNVAGYTNADGTLNVNIKVEAQQN